MRKRYFGSIILAISIVIALFPITFNIIANIPVKNGAGSIRIFKF